MGGQSQAEYALYRVLGGHQDHSRRVERREIFLLLSGVGPRTASPVASLYRVKYEAHAFYHDLTFSVNEIAYLLWNAVGLCDYAVSALPH